MNTFTRFSLAITAGLVLFACQRTPTPGSTPPAAALRLEITANPQIYTQAGQAINYSYTVTNTGTTTLGPAQFTIRDDRLGAPFLCGPANMTLTPNQNVVCSAVYTITQADVNQPSVTNAATASGAGQTSPAATVTITNLNNPSLTATPTATLASAGTLPATPGLTGVPPIRIIFEPGSITTAQVGIVNPGENVRYVLGGAQGQRLSINLTSANEISLGVNDPTGGVLKPADTTHTWSTTISTDGDYIISIGCPANLPSTAYTLEVRLETSP